MRRGGNGKRAGRGLAVLLALLLLLPGCGTGTNAPRETATAAPAASPAAVTVPPKGVGLRIAVASDLHLDPDNTDHSGLLAQASYSMELVDALLWDARRQGSDILLVTGDLVNGGKPHRHAALAEKLRQAEAEGTDVYVLPGNHDLAPVTQTEFAEAYAAFGYGEARSRDRSSLSYSVVRDGLMLLMMDTGGYRPGAIDLPGAPQRGDDEAFLSESTLRWAESQLKEAREKGLTVLAAGHYNLLTDISREPGSGFFLENGDRFAAMLKQYHVPLYLSGHMHIQAVQQEDGLTELLTGYLLNYPTGYSILDVTEDALRFTPARIDVDGWAAETGVHDAVLRNFSAWQRESFHSYCADAVNSMAKRNPLREDEARDAADFFYAVMTACWDGMLDNRREVLQTMPGCRPFFRCAEGYSYGWWLRDLMESANPMMRGFTLKR